MSSPSDPTTPSAEADTPRVSLTQLRGRMKSASKMKRDLAMRRRLYGVSPDHQSVRVSKTPGVADPEEAPLPRHLHEQHLSCGWDFAQAFILLYVGFVVPFRVGLDEPMGGWFIVDLLVDLYFWIDILLNFFTSYYDEDRGEEVFELAAISARYTRGWFWIDVAAGLPLRQACAGDVNGTFWCWPGCTKEGDGDGGFQIFQFIKLARMLKLFKALQIKRLLEKYEHHFVHYLPWVDFRGRPSGCSFSRARGSPFLLLLLHEDWWSDEEGTAEETRGYIRSSG